MHGEVHIIIILILLRAIYGDLTSSCLLASRSIWSLTGSARRDRGPEEHSKVDSEDGQRIHGKSGGLSSTPLCCEHPQF